MPDTFEIEDPSGDDIVTRHAAHHTPEQIQELVRRSQEELENVMAAITRLNTATAALAVAATALIAQKQATDDKNTALQKLLEDNQAAIDAAAASVEDTTAKLTAATTTAEQAPAPDPVVVPIVPGSAAPVGDGTGAVTVAPTADAPTVSAGDTVTIPTSDASVAGDPSGDHTVQSVNTDAGTLTVMPVV